MKTIKSVMTNFPYSIEIENHLRSAKRMMEQFKIHHLPVKSAEGYTGLLTERDVQLAADLGIMDSGEILVGDVCRKDAYVVSSEASLADVLEYLAQTHDDSVLVVENHKLVGIFTTTDACRYYAKELREREDGGSQES
ncbi:MAG: CBS domain-containing protein [Gammaproteobacteria bacterium]|nr:CBS domain-containing protein [Gammaproteobacteria bacterium]